MSSLKHSNPRESILSLHTLYTSQVYTPRAARLLHLTSPELPCLERQSRPIGSIAVPHERARAAMILWSGSAAGTVEQLRLSRLEIVHVGVSRIIQWIQARQKRTAATCTPWIEKHWRRYETSETHRHFVPILILEKGGSLTYPASRSTVTEKRGCSEYGHDSGPVVSISAAPELTCFEPQSFPV